VLAPLSIFDTADTGPDRLDRPPAFELSEQIEECRHDDAPSRQARADATRSKFADTMSSERWVDDIGDSTYVRCGKTRIPFSEIEEYCADDKVN
jgi:hypothetical protein